MLSIEEFQQIITNRSDADETEKVVSPGGSSKFGAKASLQATIKQPAGKEAFLKKLLFNNGFAKDGHPEFKVENVFQTTDRAISLEGPEGQEFREYLPEKILTMKCRFHQTIIVELKKTGSELLDTRFFRSLKGGNRLQDALVRVAQTALQGYENQKKVDINKGNAQTETLCVVSIRDDRKCEGDEAPHLVCFATKWVDKYNPNDHSLVHFFLKQECVDWEPQLRDTYLTQIYERYFSKFTTDDWQRAFITNEEWKAASRVLDEFVENKGSESLRGALEDLLEQVASNFRLKESSGRRLIFTRENEHTLGVDPADLLKDNVENPIEATIVRDNEQHLLCYIMYCLDSVEEAASLRSKFENYNCFNNVLLIAPDEDGDLCVDVWDGNRSLRDKLVQAGSQQNPKARIISTISRFFVVSKNELNNPEELACELAYRARYLKQLAIHQLNKEREEGPLRELYNAFTTQLIQQSEEEFADAYAQTLSYGLFAARWVSKHDFALTGERFDRRNALAHMPTTSPFLGKFFATVLDASFESRLTWLLDDLASLLEQTDVYEVFTSTNIGQDLTKDPVIHFYEPFLNQYNQEQQKRRGVYYTPAPVVSYVVRSIDYLIREKFSLPDGLADNSFREDGEHLVQVLDPATGTSTFLDHIIEQIYGNWNGSRGEWQNYVDKHLLPRVHGFELLMAPYAIAHLKLGLRLASTGYEFRDERRLSVLLTNTLEAGHEAGGLSSYGDWMADEARDAQKIKDNVPIMILVGNPPYSGHSANDGEWIAKLLRGEDTRDHKVTDNYFELDGEPLGERNPKWLNDDYVKFIRYAQRRVEKNGFGIVGLVTNHGYLDNPTFRGMRQSLLETFDELYFLDAHGNVNKKEISPDGSKDENVFDIKDAGICVCLLVKYDSDKDETQRVYHSDLWGLRAKKYTYFNEKSVATTSWDEIDPQGRFYLFIPQSAEVRDEYQAAIPLNELMRSNSVGIVTARDQLTIHFNKDEAWNVVEDFPKHDVEVAREKYNLRKDSQDWKIDLAQQDLRNSGPSPKLLSNILYRPFDVRSTYFTGESRGFHCRPRTDIMQHLLAGENHAIITTRSTKDRWGAFVTANIAAHKTCSAYDINYIFPLYLYTQKDTSPLLNGLQDECDERWPNLDAKFIKEMGRLLGLDYSESGHAEVEGRFGPADVFDYIYSVLHSRTYRSRYEDFLKIDFPRIPLVSERMLFRKLCGYGKSLKRWHLLEDVVPELKLATISDGGNRQVTKVGETNRRMKNVKDGIGNIYINSTTCFSRVPEDVWSFYVGGYQVCYKWLRDRKLAKRSLSDDDVKHYRKMVTSIKETLDIMQEIDDVIEAYGGWPNAFEMGVE